MIKLVIEKIKNKLYKILRSFESYTKTDMVYLVSGGFWLSLGQGISSLASFLLIIAFANLLPKELYGTYQYVLATVGILSITTLSGMGTAISRSVAKGFEGTTIKGFWIRCRFGLWGGLASIFISLYYYLQGDATLFFSFLMSSLFLPLMDPLASFNAHLQGKKLFSTLALYGFFFQLLRVVGITIALFLTNNVLLIIFAYFVVTTFGRFILFQVGLRRHVTNDKIDNGALVYGKHLSAMEVFGVIASQIDKILIWQFLGAVPLATYSFALSPVIRLQSIFRLAEPLALPKFSAQDPEVIKKTLPLKTRKFTLLMLVVTLLYILTAPLIYKLLFPQYLDSVFYSQIFAIILLFVPQKITGSAFMLHGKKKSLYSFSVLAPLSKIIALAILLPLYGIMGAIVAMIIPYVVNLIALNYFFKKI